MIPAAPSRNLVLRDFVFNTSWLVLYQLVFLVVSAIVTFWMARHLGPTRYGLLGFTIALTTVVGAVATLGLPTLLLREMVTRRNDAARLLGSAIALRLLAAIVAIPVIVGATWVVYPDDAVAAVLAVAVALSLVPQAFQSLEFWFHAGGRSREVVVSRAIALMAATLGRIAAILSAAPLVVFGVLVAAFNILEAVGFVWRFRSDPSTERLGVGIDTMGALIRRSWPFLLIDISFLTFMRVGQVLLGSMADASAVGLYVAVSQIAELPLVVPLAIQMTLLPKLVAARRVDSVRYRRRIGQLFAVATWAAIAFALPLVLAPAWLISISVGEAYREAAGALRVLGLSLIFLFPLLMQTTWTLVEELEIPRAFGLLIAAAVNILLNLLWIPRFGIEGAAWANLVTFAIAVYLPLVAFPSMRSGLAVTAGAWIYPWKLLMRRRTQPQTSGG